MVSKLIRLIGAMRIRAKIFIISGFGDVYLRMARQLGQSGGLAVAGTISKPVRAAELRKLLSLAMTN